MSVIQWGEGTSLQWLIEMRRDEWVTTNNSKGNEHLCCGQQGQGE